MTIIRRRGGAQIGWVSATWPFASIEVSHGRIQVSALGTYTFTPKEVEVVEPVGAIPVISHGIRIHHSKTEYPERVVFYTPSGRQAILAAIEAAGFRVGQPVSQAKRGFPLRWPPLVGIVLLWNLLFLLETRGFEVASSSPGPYALLALALVFALATLLPKSERLQDLFMRDGRHIGEISSALRLFQLISGVMLLGFGAAYVAA